MDVKRKLMLWVAVVSLFSLLVSAHATASAITFNAGSESVSIDLTESSATCDHRNTPGRVVIKDSKHKLVLTTSDICEPGTWRSSGRVPGLHVRAAMINTLLTGSVVVAAIGEERVDTQYHVIVKAGHKRATGWISVRVHRVQHVIEKRIYEGTDAFVNYCIDRNQEIRSHNGRLFCWLVKAWETVEWSFHFHRKHW